MYRTALSVEFVIYQLFSVKKGKTPTSQKEKSSVHDIKSDSETSALEIWEVWSTLSSPLLPGTLQPKYMREVYVV